VGDGAEFLTSVWFSLKTHYGNEELTKLVKGHNRIYEDFSESGNKRKNALKRVNINLKGAEVIDENLLFYFNAILKLAKKENITVILVKFPTTEYYYNATAQYIPDKNAFYDDIFNVTGRYDDIFILDYQKVFFHNYSLFSDSDHLNYKGAEKFSKIVREDIKKIR
jgi:hypothetical protein